MEEVIRHARPLGGSEYQRTADSGWVENRLCLWPCARVGAVYNGETCDAGSCAVAEGVLSTVAAAPAAPAACHKEQSLPSVRTRALGIGKLVRIGALGVAVMRRDLGRMWLHGLSGTIGLHRVRSGLSGGSGRIRGTCAVRGA